MALSVWVIAHNDIGESEIRDSSRPLPTSRHAEPKSQTKKIERDAVETLLLRCGLFPDDLNGQSYMSGSGVLRMQCRKGCGPGGRLDSSFCAFSASSRTRV